MPSCPIFGIFKNWKKKKFNKCLLKIDWSDSPSEVGGFPRLDITSCPRLVSWCSVWIHRGKSKFLPSYQGSLAAFEEKHLYNCFQNLNAFSVFTSHFFRSPVILTLSFRLICLAQVGVGKFWNNHLINKYELAWTNSFNPHWPQSGRWLSFFYR